MKLFNRIRRRFRKQQIPINQNPPKPKIEWASLWKIPDRIWENGFAPNMDDNHFHPALVMEILDNDMCKIIPGSTKEYNIGKCVFKLRLKSSSPKSHFLINKRMTIDTEDLAQFKKGWSNIFELNEDQREGLYNQARVCINMNLDIRPSYLNTKSYVR